MNLTIDPILAWSDEEVTLYLQLEREYSHHTKNTISRYEAMDTFKEELYTICMDKIGRGEQTEAFKGLLWTFKKFRSNPNDLDIPRAKNVSMDILVRSFGIEPRFNRCCCPFHDDKIPSMRVYDTAYYCFSCSAGGDQIDFVRNKMGYNFVEAVKFLMKF